MKNTMKGYDDLKHATTPKKYAKGDEVVVKVEGGYTVMTADYYNTWKKQSKRS